MPFWESADKKAAREAERRAMRSEQAAARKHTFSPSGQAWEYCRLTFGYGQGYDISLVIFSDDGKKQFVPMREENLSLSDNLMYCMSQLGHAGWELCGTTVTGREADLDVVIEHDGVGGKTTCFYFKKRRRPTEPITFSDKAAAH